MDTGVNTELASRTPGPELGALIAERQGRRGSLTHEQAADLAIASRRQNNYGRAMEMASTLEIALRRRGAEGVAYLDAPDRNSTELVALLLTRGRQSARLEVAFEFAAIVRLPMLHAAMVVGDLDERQVRALVTATAELTDDLARHVCEVALAGGGAGKTATELRDEALREAVACDPEAMETLYHAGVARRDVTGVREGDGTLSITARHLPAEVAAEALGYLRELARAAKRAGDPRPLAHLRAEIATGLLTRTLTGKTDEEILAHLATTRPRDGAPHDTGDTDDTDDGDFDTDDRRPAGGDLRRDDGAGPGGAGPGGAGPGGAWPDGGDVGSRNGTEPCDLAKADEGGAGGSTAAAGFSPVPVPRRPGLGIEVRVELATLLGGDEHPADLGRWGPIGAFLARQLTPNHSPGSWRFALTDDARYLLAADRLDHRPHGYRKREQAYRSSVEIILPASLLTALTGSGVPPAPIDPELMAAWRPVLAELARRTRAAAERPAPDPTRRFADTYQRRYLQARTPMCTWPHCREPATSSEIDHAVDAALGGPSDDGNQWPRCKYHHMLKSRWGWQIRITGPMTYDLISHLGTVHHITLPPAQRPLPDPRPNWRGDLRRFLPPQDRGGRE